MYYSTKGTVKARKTMSEGEEYLDRGYVRVEESAICVVRFMPFWNTQSTIIYIVSVAFDELWFFTLLDNVGFGNTNYGSNDCTDIFSSIRPTYSDTSIDILKVY